MTDNKMEKLKEEYMNVPISGELDSVVRRALKIENKSNIKKVYFYKRLGTVAAAVVICLVALTVTVNSSPAFANELSRTPVIGGIVKVLTFKEFTVKEDKFDADIKVPEIQGLKNGDLERSINEKYLEENKKLYKQFMSDMEEMKKQGSGNIGAYSGYEVKTDNDNILSVGRWETKTAADSYTVMRYDTIDKKNQILLTLPSLFKDDSYVDVISENIIAQMKEQVKSEDKVYWLDDGNTMPEDIFKKIDKNQNFYINKDGKLVISFDQFEVAPGYMGTPEFVIPTDVLSKILVSNQYVK
ncbi:anti-sigma-V factor rsiV [Aminipila terrae]|uniref:DUF3298 domain-containing protein n=1 Tax=Aminipila terrae TaxID=2697030 RepID=A0A6P1MI03_9FIRM|nr:anti-sigma-V factor rsiV [Aminipila terrae]QHI73527.1 DUF3298 domain-containing protein [Aminipila terrae]